ncbi:MAG: cation:proton antiporter [Candidatus Aenigmarchaeota archaeon]|nr:cation:proton antiporter [Candidatus Aenigmarchaeota archaeon]
MVLTAIQLLSLFGVTIVLGYAGLLIFRRTKIPDILWLLIFGVLVASFGFIDRAMFVSASPLLAALALLIILFDAGLNMDFYDMMHGFSRSFLLAIIGFILSTVAVASVSVFLLGFSIVEGLLLGAILGGSCSTIAISIISRMRMKERLRTLVTLESIITDPVSIVVALALVSMIVPAAGYSPVNRIASAFSIGALVGLVVGIAWLRLLDKLQGKPFDYMLTLAVVFLLYAGVEFAGGSGAIAALLFGLALGNGKTFSKILKMSKEYTVNPLLKTFQSEICFFIRSFFFVYLGLIVVISPQYLLYGALLAVLLILVRFVAVHLSVGGMGFTRNERILISTMAPRGLAAAVLAQLPISYGIPNAEIYSSIIFVVIFATVIYTAISVKFFYKDHHEEKQEKIPDGAEKEAEKLSKKESKFRVIEKKRKRKRAR